MKVAFDASTLILLAKIDLLRLVTENFDCVITEEVRKESAQKKKSFDANMIVQLIKEKKLKIVKVKIKKELEYEFRLGRGEVSTINLALKKKLVVATDDKLAIKVCRIFDIKFVTAIDFVTGAFEKRIISKEEAKSKINKLDEYGRYDTKVIKMALEKIGDGHE